MKTIFTALLATAFTLAVHAGDPMVMIKQKAKDISNNNNAQQGLPPKYPAPGQPAAASAASLPPPVQLTPEQRALVQLITSLDGSRQTVTTNYAEKLWESVRGVMRGPVKPAGATVTKLADDLAAALVGKPASKDRPRLAKNIEAVLNGAPAPAEDLAKDSVEILKKAGADQKAAEAVGNSLKAAAADLKKKAAAK